LNRFRSRCNRDGYESVALIPLRTPGGIVGLLQLNCRRQGAFSPETISFLEAIGTTFGPVIARRQAGA
jgi:GAF domain-containing protein